MVNLPQYRMFIVLKDLWEAGVAFSPQSVSLMFSELILEQGNEVLYCLRCANKALRWQILNRFGLFLVSTLKRSCGGDGVVEQDE